MSQHHSMPSSKQQWAHATSTIAQMESAMMDPSITAIEGDILMGIVVNDDGNSNGNSNHNTNKNNNNKDLLQPIMAHPPDRTSDLSFAKFLNIAMSQSNKSNNKILQKHLKLDFKEIQAVAPCLDRLLEIVTMSDRTVFLNADIIPGPGRTAADITVPAHDFLEQCQTAIQRFNGMNKQQQQQRFVYSLGFKVDVCSIHGHTQQEVNDMVRYIQRYKLVSKEEGQGIVVLAINARLLVKNMTPFRSFLLQYPNAQLLCWVGAGEPPIATRKVQRIRQYFGSTAVADRVGFDVQTTNLAMGILYDIIMWFMGVYHLLQAARRP